MVRVYKFWLSNGEVASSFNLPMVSYEGGQHITLDGISNSAVPSYVDFQNFILNLQRRSEFHDIYRLHLAAFSAAGGRTPSQWYDLGSWGTYGYWGAKEFFSQTSATSEKWKSLYEWGVIGRGTRAPSDTVHTSPVFLGADKIYGEVGIEFNKTMSIENGEGSVVATLVGGELPFGLSLLQSNSTSVNIVGIPTQAGTYIAVLRAMDQHGDLQDKIFYLIIDPAGMQQNKITLFNGSEIPWSPARPGYLAGGRYDPMRFGTSQEFSRMNLNFSLNDPLFANEFSGTAQISSTSPLTFYGGWNTIPIDDGSRGVVSPNPTTWNGLRNEQFEVWVGDSTGPTAFEMIALWRKDQFTDPTKTYSFGTDIQKSYLQMDLSTLTPSTSVEIRFMVIDRVNDIDRVYLSEASWTQTTLGFGIFQIDTFVNSNEFGKRWAQWTLPTGTDVFPSTTGLNYQPKTFENIQAIGFLYRASRFQYHYGFSFNRFFALGQNQ